MKSEFWKILLLVLVVVYVVSPIDALPGPIDDIIITVLTITTQNKLAEGC